LRAVFLNDAQIFIFRRIMINNQIYRQGFVLGVNAFRPSNPDIFSHATAGAVYSA